MASRAELTADIQDLIGKGNVRDAYRKFEELPIVDQIAISITPGIGDALTAYEVGEFGTRASEKVQEGDLLGGLGYGALTALGIASFVPILRFIRARKAVQPLAKNEPKLLEAPKEAIPAKFADFIKKDLDDLAYPNTSNLISPTRKFITDQAGNKLPERATAGRYVALLKKVGKGSKVTEGELRALRITDEFGRLHPQLKKQFGDREISLEVFDQYVKKNQKGLFNFKNVKKSDRHMPDITESAADELNNRRGDFSFETQKVYQVRNLEDLRKKGGSATNHYPNYDNALVFDGVIDLLGTTGKTRVVARVQSEYSKMLSNYVKSTKKPFSTLEELKALQKISKNIKQESVQAAYLKSQQAVKKAAYAKLSKNTPEAKKLLGEIKDLDKDIAKIVKSYKDNAKFVSEYKMPSKRNFPELADDIDAYYKKLFYDPTRPLSTVPGEQSFSKFLRANADINNPVFKGKDGKEILKAPVSFRGSDKLRRGPFDDKDIARVEVPTVRENIAAAAADPNVSELVFSFSPGVIKRDAAEGVEYIKDLYDKKIPAQVTKVLKELGMEKKIIIDPRFFDNFSASEADIIKKNLDVGFTIQIDDQLRKAIAEKGISAFRSGGAVDPRISKGMGFDGLDEIERKLSALQIPYDYTKDGKLKIV